MILPSGWSAIAAASAFAPRLVTTRPSPPKALSSSPPAATASGAATTMIAIATPSASDPRNICTEATSAGESCLRRCGVATHAVEQHREEPVGKRIRIGVGTQPCVRPIRGGEGKQRRRRIVEVRAELAELPPLPKDRLKAFFVAAALGDERLTPLPLEVAPLADEHRRDVELLRDDTQVRAERGLDLLCRAQLLGDAVERLVEGDRTVARDFPEQVRLRLDVGVQRPLLDAHGLR